MAQVQTPQEKADAFLVKAWDDIIIRMDEFIVEHSGRYYQGIRTPPVIPPDGALRPLDKTLKPSDQPEDWTAFDTHGKIPNNLPCSIEIHIHDGPLGKGYTFYGWVTDAAGTWVRAQGNGPYSSTFPWRLQNLIKP